MRALVVVKLYPVADYAAGVLQCLKAVAMRTLLLQSTDHTLHHPILLRTVWRDEFLLETITTDQGREVATGENQAIVATQKERSRYTAQRAKAGNQRMLQGA